MTNPSLSAEPYLAGKKPLKITVVGGSCAGLFAGILLKRQGHDVHILESALSNEREGLAAGVGLAAQVKAFFDQHDRLKDIPFGTPNNFMEVNDSNMNVRNRIPVYLQMTTWDATYYRLRANFDAYKSSYCEEPPALDPSEGQGTFDTGKRVLGVNQMADCIEVAIQDVRSGAQERYQADIVIAADGCNSSIRRQLQPNLQREEAGYVLWRGTVPTKDLSKTLLDRLEGHTTLYPMQYSYSIIYTIPGVNGSLEDGEREINFAWYFWTSKSDLAEILTDTFGHQHRTTLPKGQMRPEIWQRQLEHARRTFHPNLIELVEKIKEPFVSIVSSVSSTRAAFFNNRLFLIGDALAQKQPNTAQGVNYAAIDAMSLADMIAGKVTPLEWEEQALENADRERLRSLAFASKFLNGWFGYLYIQLRYRCMLASQRWTKWLLGSAYPRVRARI